MQFRNRHEAGKKLAEKLKKYKNKKDVIILGIPRGGVEVGFDIAKILKIPLSIVITKKIGYLYEPEFAIGAVNPDGNYILDKEYETKGNRDYIKNTIKELKQEIKKRYKKYTNGILPNLKNKIVIIVDDGLATGFTMFSAIEYVKTKKPKKVIVAVGVAAQETLTKANEKADVVICLQVPSFFGAVGAYYQDFSQLEDKEVIFYLEEAQKYC